MTTRTQQSQQSQSQSQQRCDICQKSATFRGQLGLRTCCKCGVNVHDTCYGIPPTGYPHANWECHACSYIGKKVLISKPNDDSKKEDIFITQHNRPMDCALCPIQTGYHAMHPLYDTGGSSGRHDVLVAHPARGLKKRLAFVHTACAIGISTSRRLQGCVYGCFEDGSYEDENGLHVEVEVENNNNNNNNTDDDDEDETEFELGNDETNNNDDNDDNDDQATKKDNVDDNDDAKPSTTIKRKIESNTAVAAADTKANTKADTKAAVAEGFVDESIIPIGTKVKRKFNGGEVYNGKIVSYDEIEKFYKIRYDDGDEEERDINQVQQCINGKIGDFSSDDDNDVQYEMTHHYVIVGKEEKNSKDRGTSWIQQKKWIKDMRNNTKCIFCGNSKKVCPPTHIPMQCTAGEEGEHQSFRKHHTNEVNKGSCQQAMHIGCAIWGDNFKYNRLQMDPGFGNDSEPMLELFCNLHAQDYVEGHKAEKLAEIKGREGGEEWKPHHDDSNDDNDNYVPLMRAAPISSKLKASSSASSYIGGVKRKSAATMKTTATKKANASSTTSSLLGTNTRTNTTTTSLNRDSKKQLKVGRIESKVYEIASSRNSRTREALCQSDSRDFAIALHAGGGSDENDDDEDDDKNKMLSKRSMILNQGLKSMKKKSGGGGNGDDNDSSSPQCRSSSIVSSLAVAGRKRKAPPTRNEQEEQQRHSPMTWSAGTEDQRNELLSKLKKNAVYEIFREFGNKRSGGVPIVQVQKEYWRRELVGIEDDGDDDNINNKGDQHYQQQQQKENGNTSGITRMSIDEFKVLWKKVKKLLRDDETLATAIDGYKKGDDEVINNNNNKDTNQH